MNERFERTERLLGSAAMKKLEQAHVAVFGVGGVGGYCVEALARSGVGRIELIDNDTVAISNLNRQIIALSGTLGMPKVDAAKERILQINPDARVTARKCFYLPENAHLFDFSAYDYVVDAVDTVTAKIDIILKAQESGTPVISAMGAGNKIDPTAFRVADIYETSGDPLAKVMRRELRKRGVRNLKVVYSTEQPREMPAVESSGETDSSAVNARRKATPWSCAFVPGVAGLIIAGEVIRDLTGIKG